MTDQDPVLGLLDDVLAILEGADATSVEITADGFAISVHRRPGRVRAGPRPADARTREAATESARVRSPGVGIFSSAREWRVGDHVAQGDVLGGVQSLGHVAEITAPLDGTIREILTASGAPVEYGQPLFSLERS